MEISCHYIQAQKMWGAHIWALYSHVGVSGSSEIRVELPEPNTPDPGHVAKARKSRGLPEEWKLAHSPILETSTVHHSIYAPANLTTFTNRKMSSCVESLSSLQRSSCVF